MTVLNQSDVSKIAGIYSVMETSRHPVTQRQLFANGVRKGFVTFYRKSGSYHTYLEEMTVQKNARSFYDFMNEKFPKGWELINDPYTRLY